MDQECVFCGRTLSGEEPTTKLREKGCEGIAKANVLRNCNITTVPGQVVHIKCRRIFVLRLAYPARLRDSGQVLTLTIPIPVLVDQHLLHSITRHIVYSVVMVISTIKKKNHICYYPLLLRNFKRLCFRFALSATMPGQLL